MLLKAQPSPVSSFNLVIERLLISGHFFDLHNCDDDCFNLVIERLLISGQQQQQRHLLLRHASFNLVIERLLISGKPCGSALPLQLS